MSELGKIAFEAFRESLESQGIMSDSWDNLEDADQIAWEAVADAICSRGGG
jgi:hypothetical protein